MRRILPGIFFLISVSAVAALPGDRPACRALFYEDRVLVAALPKRIRTLVESSRVRTLMVDREAKWADFHAALDEGFEHEKRPFQAELGPFTLRMAYERNFFGDIKLRIEKLSVARDAGGNAARPFEFLELIAAELDWVAKARASGRLTGFTMIAEDAGRDRFGDLLESLGFDANRRYPPRIDRRCVLAGIVGGAAGFGAGKVFFMAEDSDVENGSIFEEQRKFYRDVGFGAGGGALTALAIFCRGDRTTDYSLELGSPRVAR